MKYNYKGEYKMMKFNKMLKAIKEMKTKLAMYMMILVVNGVPKVHALSGFDAPQVNEEALNELTNSYTSPALKYLYGIVPVITIIVCIVEYLKYQFKDENEKDQKPFGKTVMRNIMIMILVLLLPTLFKALGVIK